MSLNLQFIHWETLKLQGLCKLPIMTNLKLMTFLRKTRQIISSYQI